MRAYSSVYVKGHGIMIQWLNKIESRGQKPEWVLRREGKTLEDDTFDIIFSYELIDRTKKKEEIARNE